MIKVGRITGAHGEDGAVKVETLTDRNHQFAPGSVLMLGGASLRIEWSEPAQPGLVVKFEGMSARTLAELHSGQFLVAATEGSEG